MKLVDPTRNTNRDDVKIWMNNPLRLAGETFYQSGYNESTRTVIDPSTGRPERKKIEITTLAVVSNAQWMIPYVGCMIVLVGMLAQLVLTLMRFLKRQDEVVQPGEAPTAAVPPTASHPSEPVE